MKHSTKAPWELEETPWKTEAEFWNWVKGAIRKGWSRHPVRTSLLRSKRVKAPLGRKTKKNPEGVVWAVECDCCNTLVRQNDSEVDHINATEHERWYDDISAFVIRMYFVTFDDLQILCKPCHRIKSLADKLKCSFERAKYIEKPRIEFSKKKAKEQVDILTNLDIIPLKTKEQRVGQYVKCLEENYETIN